MEQDPAGLAASLARYRTLFAAIDDMVQLKDLSGRYLEVNPAFARKYGLTREEVIGRTVLELQDTFDPASGQAIVTQDRHVAETGQPLDYIETVRMRTGESRIHHTRKFAARDESGAIVGIVSVGRDITDRQRAERALRDSRDLYTSVYDSASDAVFIVSVRDDGAFVYEAINPALQTATGLRLQDLVGHTPHECLPRDVADHVAARYAEAVKAGHVVQYEEVLSLPAGTRTWSTQLVPIRDAEGRIHRLAGISRDLTDDRRAAAERERTLARERALAEAGRALVSATEFSDVLNTVLELGIGVLDSIAATIWSADVPRRELKLLASRGAELDPHDAPYVIGFDAPRLAARAAATQRIQVVERLSASDVKVVVFKTAVAQGVIQAGISVPLLVEGRLVGVVTFAFGTARQFTPSELEFVVATADMFAMAIEKARLNSDLRERERQICQLLDATLTAQEGERQRVCLEVHDGVAQTLASAANYLQVLSGHVDLPESLRAHVARTERLVDTAMREARAIISSLRPVALDTLGLVPTLRHELNELALETALRVSFRADEVRLASSVETAIYRIVREAVTNVVRHAHARQLEVRVTSAGGGARVEVGDDGVGFDVDQARNEEHHFGLLSMRRRAEMLGGEFSIQSRRGEGTHIVVDIPRPPARVPTDKSNGAATPTPEAPGPNDPVSVLIVDDHVVAREGLRAMLETDERIRVVGEAESGEQALVLAQLLRPRVVLMDLRLPGMDGLLATRQLKTRQPEAAVVVTTSYQSSALVVSALRAGASSFVLKGAPRATLTQTIHAVAGGATLISADILGRAMDALTEQVGAFDDRPPDPHRLDHLTQRELKVLTLLAEGKPDAEIAATLGYSVSTVRRDVRGITHKLGVTDRIQTAVMGFRLGLVRH